MLKLLRNCTILLATMLIHSQAMALDVGAPTPTPAQVLITPPAAGAYTPIAPTPAAPKKPATIQDFCTGLLKKGPADRWGFIELCKVSCNVDVSF